MRYFNPSSQFARVLLASIFVFLTLGAEINVAVGAENSAEVPEDIWTDDYAMASFYYQYWLFLDEPELACATYYYYLYLSQYSFYYAYCDFEYAIGQLYNGYGYYYYYILLASGDVGSATYYFDYFTTYADYYEQAAGPVDVTYYVNSLSTGSNTNGTGTTTTGTTGTTGTDTTTTGTGTGTDTTTTYYTDTIYTTTTTGGGGGGGGGYTYYTYSDQRLKTDIELVGVSPLGINIYQFRYLNSPKAYQGVMAQEVPWASKEGAGGYLMVDYSLLDVEFKEID